MFKDAVTFSVKTFKSVICLLPLVSFSMCICAAFSVTFPEVVTDLPVSCMDINTLLCKIVAYLMYSSILVSAFM